MPCCEPDIYVYKLVTDNGGAPCATARLLSLALCKPKIRKSCSKGSLILGFGGKNYQERLIYIAQVTAKLEGDAYLRKRDYARRVDCIYRSENGKAVRKVAARYHYDSDHRNKDVGLHFEKAFVLLSDDFRYLGRNGTAGYKKQFPWVRKMIEGLKRGHRRFHSRQLREELLQLKHQVWSRYRRMKVGAPTEDDRSRAGNAETPSGRC